MSIVRGRVLFVPPFFTPNHFFMMFLQLWLVTISVSAWSKPAAVNCLGIKRAYCLVLWNLLAKRGTYG